MFTDVMAFNFLGTLYFMQAGSVEGLRVYYSSRAARVLSGCPQSSQRSKARPASIRRRVIGAIG